LDIHVDSIELQKVNTNLVIWLKRCQMSDVRNQISENKYFGSRIAIDTIKLIEAVKIGLNEQVPFEEAIIL